MNKKIIVLFFSLLTFIASVACADNTEKEILPKKIWLKVPFLCQAPYANWNMPWKEACEEAAIIMAIHFVNDYPIGKEAGNQEILGLVNFQKIKYGGHYDLTAEQTAKLMKDYYKFDNFKIVYDFTVEDMKKELANGNLVLTPAAGRMLGNKYFRTPGPIYHFVVFKGYDDQKGEFITNDPGTKRGNGYRYKYNIAYDAIHDWTGNGATIKQGKKVMIVIQK